MVIQTVQSYIHKYEAKIAEWDTKTDPLSEDQRARYYRMRDAFIKRIEVWKQSLKNDFDVLQENIDEGFEELEAEWYRIKKK